MITIDNNQITIDGNLAGSLEDALVNFPVFTQELWAGLNTQNKQLRNDLDQVTGEFQLLANTYNQLKIDYDELVVDNKAAASVTPAPVNTNRITTAEFRAQFTDVQLAKIWLLSLTDNVLAVFLIKSFMATTIDLESADVKAGLEYLKVLGI